MANVDAIRLAVLIDADNASASVAKELLEEIAKYGTATVKRAFGDWTTQNIVEKKGCRYCFALRFSELFS